MATQSSGRLKNLTQLSQFIPILSWLPRYNRAWLAR